MSYILDALRKAEQKRHRGAKVPTLATIHRHPVPVRPPIRLRLWLWVAGAVIVVNAGAVTWLLLPAGTKSTASLDTTGSFSPPGPAAPSAPGATAPSVPAPPRAPATPPVVAPPIPATGRVPASESGRATPDAAETKSGARPARPPAAVKPDQPGSDQKTQTPALTPVPPASMPTTDKPVAAPRSPATPAAPERAAPSPPAVAVAPPANQAKPPERAPGSPGTTPQPTPQATPQLTPQATPQAVRDMLAKLKLQMVVYSDVPAERLVFINDKKYVEGSSIDGTLRVDSINPDSAVLSHQGQRFVIRQ
jgi:Type II secretion system protein B